MDIDTLVRVKGTDQKVGKVVGFMGLPKGFVLVRFTEGLQKIHPTKLVPLAAE